MKTTYDHNVNHPRRASHVHLRERMNRVKGALQLLMNRYGEIRFAHVHERVLAKSFVVLIIGNSKSNQLGAQGTFKGYGLRQSRVQGPGLRVRVDPNPNLTCMHNLNHPRGASHVPVTCT